MIELESKTGRVLFINPEDLTVAEYDKEEDATKIFIKYSQVVFGIKGNYYDRIKEAVEEHKMLC